MQISWFEIIAQIINFFVLLFILQKLLYKPVMNAMASRQERIQKYQVEADETMGEAKQLISEYDAKIAEADDEKRSIISDARQEARDQKERLLKEYRQEAEAKRTLYLKEIEDEKEAFLTHLRQNLGNGAVKIAAHILRTISSKELEEEVFKTFAQTLRELNSYIEDVSELADETDVTILSSRLLTQAEQVVIQNALKKHMPQLNKLTYDVQEDLIIGHELELETYTIHTNIKHYLKEVEDDIMTQLETDG